MTKRHYRIVLTPAPAEEGGGYTVTVPALPGCVTEGDTLEEAIAMVRDAIEGYIESLRKHGEPIPEDEPASEPATLTIDLAA